MPSRLRSPSTDFRAVRDGLNSGPFYFDIQLSTARNDFVLPVSGNSFYIDANPNDGNAFCAFRNYDTKNADTEFYVSPGFIYRGGFTELRLSWAAQSGKKIRIVYGTDIDFQPGSVAQLALAGQVDLSAQSKVPLQNNGQFNSAGNVSLFGPQILSANTPLLVYTGSLTNTTLLQGVTFEAFTGPDGGIPGIVSLLMAPSRPANVGAGVCIVLGTQGRVSNYFTGHLNIPIVIPAGQNLYLGSLFAVPAGNWNYVQTGRLV